MRAAGRAALCLLCALLLCGCAAEGHEPSELTVVRLAAVDRAGETVTITAFPAPLAVGGEPEAQENRVGTGADPTEACLTLAADGGSLAFLGHTEHILIGEELAASGVKTLLECAVLDGGMRPDAYLWLVEGDTAASLGQSAGGDSGAKLLSAYCTDSGARRRVMAWTAAQALNRLLRTGVVLVPVLSAGGEPAGYALLTKDGVAERLTDKSAEGLELLLGQTCHHTLKAGETVLELSAVSTKVEPVWSGGVLTGVKVLCRVTARRANNGSHAEKDIANAEAALERWANVRLSAVLNELKTQNVDGGELRHRALAALLWKSETPDATLPYNNVNVMYRVDARVDF